MRRHYGVWLAAAALAALLYCGCSGILAESEQKNGQTETLRLGTTTSWSSYDRNSIKQDDSAIMLKKESTF